MPNILHVEDDETLAAELATLLAADGYETAYAPDPSDDPIALVLSHRPDLVISDVTMPNMSGFEFIRRLRLDKRFIGLPIIFYTSIGDGKEGVQAFLDKRDARFEGKASNMPSFYPWWE